MMQVQKKNGKRVLVIDDERSVVAYLETLLQDNGYETFSAENGRAAVEIIMAIYESARLHEVVAMPVITRCSPLEAMIEAGDLPVERPGRYDIRAFLLRGENMRP